MDDASIVRLFWDRKESAISEASNKYGAYCASIARNILFNTADAEECVNDTWLQAWNAMPPHKPAILAVFLGKITRNLSFDMYRKLHRQKRGGYNIDASLDELAECVSGAENTERQLEAKELKAEINRFLASLSQDKRCMFILRYWYADSIADIAKRMELSETNVTVTLSRIRGKLKTYLIERGFDV